MSQIYQPAEDSFLMQKVLKSEIPKLLKRNPNLDILEVGCGSGINLQTLSDLKIKNIFACDINSEAVQHCKELGFNCVESDLFEKFLAPKGVPRKTSEKVFTKGNKFDLIIFNPPYLPQNPDEPKDSQIATTGGKKGSEIINLFLKDAKKYLKKDGKIFLLVSSLTHDINFSGWKKILLDKEKIFFEELVVWELKPQAFSQD